MPARARGSASWIGHVNVDGHDIHLVILLMMYRRGVMLQHAKREIPLDGPLDAVRIQHSEPVLDVLPARRGHELEYGTAVLLAQCQPQRASLAGASWLPGIGQRQQRFFGHRVEAIRHRPTPAIAVGEAAQEHPNLRQ